MKFRFLGVSRNDMCYAVIINKSTEHRVPADLKGTDMLHNDFNCVDNLTDNEKAMIEQAALAEVSDYADDVIDLIYDGDTRYPALMWLARTVFIDRKHVNENGEPDANVLNPLTDSALVLIADNLCDRVETLIADDYLVAGEYNMAFEIAGYLDEETNKVLTAFTALTGKNYYDYAHENNVNMNI